MSLTPEQVATISQQIPGFDNLSPEQQDQMAIRLGLARAAKSYSQQNGETQGTPAGGVASLAVPVAAGVGINQGINAITSSPSVMSSIANYGNAGALANDAASGASAASTPGTTAGLGTFGTALSALGILHGGYGLLSNFGRSSPGKGATSGAEVGAGVGTLVGGPGIGTGIGAGIGAAAGGLLGMLHTGKSKDQQGRDSYRQILQQAGIYDNDFNLTLSDGTKVNMGLDGSVKNYNVDFTQPGIDKIVGIVNPFAFLVAQGDQKKANDLAGELTNALKGVKDPVAEMRNIFTRAGIDRNAALSGIDQLAIDPQTKNIFKASINQLGLPVAGSSGVTGVHGGGGFSIKFPAQKPVDTRGPFLMSLLNEQMNKSSQPIPYPTPNSQPQAQQVVPNNAFNSTLNRIIGG